ncbi:MAG: peptidoglycan DD-metalloendopeptidase family protein [Muribaculaceae bacterium]|nr:peptidoglycan DD-metalloendopeptidase family protein [Muribaculaceae bacterium]
MWSYAGLGSVGVRKGESVKTGQNLGSLAAADGHSILHFEIRDEKQKLNPSLWLR